MMRGIQISLLIAVGSTALLVGYIEQSRTYITIFVHGSRGSFPSPLQLLKGMGEVNEELFDCPLGMWRIDDLERKNHFWTVADLLERVDPLRFPREHYYAFGWSGKLSFKVRQLAAHRLYGELKRLIARYEACDGITPHVTVITHSHGGNVALNLAYFYQLDKEPSFKIDRLVLLACPVQGKTAPFTASELFKKVYSLHSHRDSLQVLDPQGFHSFRRRVKKVIRTGSLKALWKRSDNLEHPSFFSQRHFHPQTNLVQARIRWSETRPWDSHDVAILPKFQHAATKIGSVLKMPRDLMHLDFLIPSFLERLPMVLDGLDAGLYEPLPGTVDRYVPL